MVHWWMMFRKIVCKVCFPRPLINPELSLGFVVTQQVEVHVHGLHLLWLNFAVDNSFRHQVVGLDRDS